MKKIFYIIRLALVYPLFIHILFARFPFVYCIAGGCLAVNLVGLIFFHQLDIFKKPFYWKSQLDIFEKKTIEKIEKSSMLYAIVIAVLPYCPVGIATYVSVGTFVVITSGFFAYTALSYEMDIQSISARAYRLSFRYLILIVASISMGAFGLMLLSKGLKVVELPGPLFFTTCATMISSCFYVLFYKDKEKNI